MKLSSMLVFFLLSVLCVLIIQAQSTTILVDGVSEWNNPSVHVGDSVIFKHKYNYKLYIFQNKKAFNLCNFTQSTLLTKPNSTSYTWNPSRPGFFYFTFNNGSLKTCQGFQKLSIEVSPLAPMAAPAPNFGGIVSSSPSYPWPFRPHQDGSSPGPAPAPSASSPVTMPTLVPGKGGGIPFISSNPAVPLPTGEVDSATIRPFPTSAHPRQVAVGFLAGQMVIFTVTVGFLMML
ncbi:hypothetical protein Ddye_005568 [Dipteronia dyeriana]|uniref:Cupredoxin n=1 Tax=Dipteronia dyeriana TaxID=168575 RepID=A0AAE0CPR8_9ROSI|nr:hypothetical protein Ddye_005568 [Dipteronia dyeriana]